MGKPHASLSLARAVAGVRHMYATPMRERNHLGCPVQVLPFGDREI